MQKTKTVLVNARRGVKGRWRITLGIGVGIGLKVGSGVEFSRSG
jgi:hypothetical protein